jgi:TIR domain
MASLADTPNLVGFFSYSRADDEGSKGKLSRLREFIQEELRAQLGRTNADFRLWQDQAAIAHGELWENKIKSAVAESVFFIPIITPTAIRSRECKFEFDAFLAREKELGRDNLIFPILYIPVPALEDNRRRLEDQLLSIIHSRQYEDLRNLRHLDAFSSEAVALRVQKFCANIVRALEQNWLSPEEREQFEAQQRAEAEDRQQEQRQQAEDRRRDEERRRLEEDKAAARAEHRRDRLKQWVQLKQAWLPPLVGGLAPALPFALLLFIISFPDPKVLPYLQGMVVVLFIYGATAGALTQRFGIQKAAAIPVIPAIVLTSLVLYQWGARIHAEASLTIFIACMAVVVSYLFTLVALWLLLLWVRRSAKS